MKLMIKERTFTTGMIILAVVVVIVLGLLQYRWSNQVSEATSIRLADSLQMSMINWHLDFFRAVSEICVALRVDSDADAAADSSLYAVRYADWKKATANPGLVTGIYVARMGDSPETQLAQLAPSSLRFGAEGWPPAL